MRRALVGVCSLFALAAADAATYKVSSFGTEAGTPDGACAARAASYGFTGPYIADNGGNAYCYAGSGSPVGAVFVDPGSGFVNLSFADYSAMSAPAPAPASAASAPASSAGSSPDMQTLEQVALAMGLVLSFGVGYVGGYSR